MGRFVYRRVTVYRHFPELCRQIAQRYADYKTKRAIARRAQAAEEVERVACELHAKGISLTRQHILLLLASSAYLNLEEGRMALRKVRRELAHSSTN